MGILNLFKKPEIPIETTPEPKAKILVADDEQFLRESYQELLTQEGYQVITASNGQEALDLVSQNRPNLILLDIQMPVLDGNEFLRKLRDNEQTKNIPVIVLTNAGNLNNMDTAKLYSAYKFLIKCNITPADVINTVSEALKATAYKSA